MLMYILNNKSALVSNLYFAISDMPGFVSIFFIKLKKKTVFRGVIVINDDAYDIVIVTLFISIP